MPLSYHRSTPSQFGNWPFSHTDEGDSSPNVPVTSIPEVIAKRFSGSYDYKPSTATFTPSIIRFASPQFNKELPPTPPPTWNAAPFRLMPPATLPSSPTFEHAAALPSSPITPNFSLERCSSLLDPAVLDRLSPLDALQQELFEAESLCCSSPDMPTFQVQDYDSIVEASIRSPSPNLRPLRLPSMRREEYAVVGLRSPSMTSDQSSETESKTRRYTRLGNVFRLRGKSDRCEEEGARKVQQKSALTCPAYSFLDMSDDEEDEGNQESPIGSRVLASLNRLNPINAVRQRAASSQTIERAKEAKAERNHDLRRTTSKPAGLSLTRSATSLFSALPSSFAAAVRSPKLSTSPTLSFTSSKSNSRKAKVSVAAIRRTDEAPLTLTSTPPANALGLHDAYGEAVKLGDHLNQHFLLSSPPPPAPKQDDHSDPLDAFESPKLSRGRHCSRRRHHRHNNLKGLNDPSLILGSPSSFTSYKSEEEADRTATPTTLQCQQATDPDSTPSASRYARYSPPVCHPALPRSATTDAVKLKRSIRSSSDGEMPISLKKSYRSAKVSVSSPSPMMKRSVSSQTVAARRRGPRGSNAPPPFPPPSCPLPPLPALFRKHTPV